MKPYFVMGSWHSGTRLIVKILSCALPVVSHNAETYDLSTPEMKRFFIKFLSKNCIFTGDDINYFKKLLKQESKKYGGEFVCKLPIFSYCGKFLNHCYSKCKLINIVRNGLDVSVSDLGMALPGKKKDLFLNSGRAYAYFGEWKIKYFNVCIGDIDPYDLKRPPNKHLFAAQLWKRATMKSISNRSYNNYYEIKYEELVSNPIRVATDLMKNLELDFDKNKLKKICSKINNKYLHRWKKHYSKSETREIMKLINTEMRMLGYS